MSEPTKEQLLCEAHWLSKGHEMMRYPGTDNYVRDYDDGLWDAWQARDDEVAGLTSQLEIARQTNKVLHRRLQKAEAPAQSYEAQLRYAEKMAGEMWGMEFRRLGRSYQEMKRIFLECARAREYPQQGTHLHSVMDSNAENYAAGDEGIFANCFLTERGGIKSFRVLDEVSKVVDELLALRAQAQTLQGDGK